MSSTNRRIAVYWIEPGVDDAGRWIEEIVDLQEFEASEEGHQNASALAAHWKRQASAPERVTITGSREAGAGSREYAMLIE